MHRFALVNEENNVENVCVGESLETMPEIDGCRWIVLESQERVNPSSTYQPVTDEFTNVANFAPSIFSQPIVQENMVLGLQSFPKKKSYSTLSWLKMILSFGLWR